MHEIAICLNVAMHTLYRGFSTSEPFISVVVITSGWYLCMCLYCRLGIHILVLLCNPRLSNERESIECYRSCGWRWRHSVRCLY